jgi:hypothetical protein
MNSDDLFGAIEINNDIRASNIEKSSSNDTLTNSNYTDPLRYTLVEDHIKERKPKQKKKKQAEEKKET